ncbi:hypothetical protein [Fundidesulfovibrio magnetotacticus]|uniref:hypothetical protein n=1 Tax=Fundidesulfovibrio magnetotacticus TaxID=2730080 RepID=UPI001565BF24|nr:hypothetical protein [Fundidesulfovibrio magnetotacticus]
MGDEKYVKTVADSYGQAQQNGSGINPATRDAFDRITQQQAPTDPPLVDPAVNAEIANRQMEIATDVKVSEQREKIQARLDKMEMEQREEDAEAGRRAQNAKIAGYVGTTAGGLMFGAGEIAPAPLGLLLKKGSVPFGLAVANNTEFNLNNPAYPEQDVTGMNGQDFEGIGRR